MRAIRLVILAAFGLTAGGAAYAQDFHSSPYSQSVYDEGPGFRLGSAPLVLHPGVAADFGYDSNVYYGSSNPIGSGLMRLRAHLDLATLPPQYFENDDSAAVRKVDFRLSGQAEYREYLTGNSRVQQLRSINGMANFGLNILPTGPFTLTIADDYVHTVDPRNFDAIIISGFSNFTRDFNRATLTGKYHTAGDTLEIGAGGFFEFNLWQDDVTFANNYYGEGQAFAKWRLLPRTTLALVVRAGYVDYINDTKINSTPVRAVATFSSLFSTWFGFSVSAGYGNSINSNGPSYNMFVGGADIKFIMPFRSTIHLLYDRDFYNTMIANYFVDDHIGVLYEQPLLRWLKASVEGAVRFREYDNVQVIPPFTAISSTTRNDIVYVLRAEVTVRATSWLAFSANYNLIADSTNFQWIQGGVPEPINYIKHSVFGRIDIAY